MNGKICPMINGVSCKKNECAWYDEEMGVCCIKTAARALDSLTLLVDAVREDLQDGD